MFYLKDKKNIWPAGKKAQKRSFCEPERDGARWGREIF